MSYCCDQMAPLGCDQGRLCPSRHPSSCEALAVCQHPERECQGACEQIPGLSVSYAGDEPSDQELLRQRETRLFRATVIALVVITLPLVCACAGYVWFKWQSGF